MLWSKQFYHYIVQDWLEGDPGQPTPPDERKRGRNAEWRHLYNERVMSMPDKWEYPWYASWDLAFHCIPLALVDRALRQGAARSNRCANGTSIRTAKCPHTSGTSAT